MRKFTSHTLQQFKNGLKSKKVSRRWRWWRKERIESFLCAASATGGKLFFFYLEDAHEHGDIRLGQFKFYLDFVGFLRDFQIIERGLGQFAFLARQA